MTEAEKLAIAIASNRCTNSTQREMTKKLISLVGRAKAMQMIKDATK